MRDKRFNCGAVLTIIKAYKYMIYIEIFVTVKCGAGRDNSHHSSLSCARVDSSVELEILGKSGLNQ